MLKLMPHKHLNPMELNMEPFSRNHKSLEGHIFQ